jgi:ribosomal protein S18 acetylase RimI-like enzyme
MTVQANGIEFPDHPDSPRVSSMASAITLRPARADDLGFVGRVYLRAMGPTLQRAAGLSLHQQAELLAAHWSPTEIRIIAAAGREVGWIQAAPMEAAVFVRNFCIDPDYQRLGIGTAVMHLIIGEAAGNGDAVALGVAKGNPARRLYERLGFRQTHDDAHHDYLWFDAKAQPRDR